MSIEDIASQSSVVLRHGIQHNWKDTISGVHVHVSPSSAETLVRKGGITNNHLIAHSLSNISAKNYQHRLMYVEVIMCNISVVFRDTVYISNVFYVHVMGLRTQCWFQFQAGLASSQWFGIFRVQTLSRHSKPNATDLSPNDKRFTRLCRMHRTLTL